MQKSIKVHLRLRLRITYMQCKIVFKQLELCWMPLHVWSGTPASAIADHHRLLQDDLHGLDVPQRVQCELAVAVHRCLRNQLPTYIGVYCVPLFDVAGSRHLRSAAIHQLTVLCVCRSTFSSRAFASAGPTVWNSLPEYLRNDQFWRDAKNVLICSAIAFRRERIRDC